MLLAKRFLIITGVILVVIFIATKILHDQIQYKLEAKGIIVENLSLNLFTRSASLENITYRNGDDSIHIDQLTVSSFKALKFFTRNKLELGDVTILNPHVIKTILYDDPVQESTSPNAPLEEILIHTLSISRLNLEISDKSHLRATVDFKVIDFTLSREMEPSLKNITALIENLTYIPKDSLHTIQLRSLSLNSSADNLRVDSLIVTPNYSKADFGKKGGFQTDRLEIMIPCILISGISGSSLKDSVVSISRVDIPSSQVSVFRDKRQPFNENQRKDIPGELLRKLPIALVVDSILIKNSNIVYAEQPEASDKTFIEIIFTSLQANMSGINTTKTSNKKYATLLASSKFMNDGLIDAKFQIPLMDKLAHTANGTVINLDLTSLNPILSNLGRITIEKGALQQLRFSFSYDNYTAKGDVEMKYKNFELKVLNASHKKDETLSSLINLVINNDKVQTKHGLIDIERDRKRFVFNLWWKALANGIKNSVNPLKSDKRK